QKSITAYTKEYFTYQPDSTFLPKVATSEDGKLKIYSYDNALGGTMRYYDKIWLYNSNINLDKINVIYDEDSNEAKGMVYDIKSINFNNKTHYFVFGQNIYSSQDIRYYVEAYQIVYNNYLQKLDKINVIYDEDSNEAKGMVYDIKSINFNNKTHYFVFGQNIYSSQDIRNYVEAYQIINNELVPSKLFSTPNKASHSLYVDYNFNSVIDREERPVQLIKLINDTLKVTIVDDLGNVTDEFEYYIRKKNDSLFKYIK